MFNKRDAARFLGVDPSEAGRLCRSGQLPAKLLNGRPVFTLPCLERAKRGECGCSVERLVFFDTPLTHVPCKRYPEILGYEYIYLFAADGGLVKIGKARNIGKRLTALNSSCPVRLALLGYAVRPIADGMEKKLHRLLRPYKVKGEWFSVTANEIHEIACALFGADCKLITGVVR